MRAGTALSIACVLCLCACVCVCVREKEQGQGLGAISCSYCAEASGAHCGAIALELAATDDTAVLYSNHNSGADAPSTALALALALQLAATDDTAAAVSAEAARQIASLLIEQANLRTQMEQMQKRIPGQTGTA
eukprot:1160477-Pelagomonas_calceolata.AAC.13